MNPTVNSIPKAFSVFLGLLLALLGVVFLTFSTLAFHVIAKDFSFVGSAGWIFFFLFGAFLLGVGLTLFKKITTFIEDGQICIQRLGLFTAIYPVQNLYGWNSYTFRNKWRSYRAFFIETVDREQISFTEADFDNFDEIRNAVACIVPRNKALKRNDWLNINKKIYWLTAGVSFIVYILSFAFEHFIKTPN